MKVAVIGPTNQDVIVSMVGMPKEEIEKRCAHIGELIAKNKHELHTCPDDGVTVLVARSYKKSGGKKLIGYVPKEGAKWGYGKIKQNLPLLDKKVVSHSWDHLPSMLMKSVDIVICLGLSSGTMWELSTLKWINKQKTKVKLFVVSDMISRLPKELEFEFRDFMKYVSLTDLDGILK